MKTKLVMDSAGDIQTFDGIDFTCVPLKISTDTREFVDDEHVDVTEMVDYLLSYKGKATTACPGVGEYLEAFGDAEEVYCITITGTLSGSYNAACVAARDYMEKYPQRKVHVVDSLSTGPEMLVLAEKIRELVAEEKSFETIVEEIEAYKKTTRLAFSLESLHNLANNGRVPAAVAKITGVLGIRLIGKASDVGDLQPTGKARGEKKVVTEMVDHILKLGYNWGQTLFPIFVALGTGVQATKIKKIKTKHFEEFKKLKEKLEEI